jgi:hypothetical protein
VGYEATLRYNGSALAVTRDPEVQSDWYVELEQDGETLGTFDHDPADEFFVASLENVSFNESESFSVEVYENASDSTSNRLVSLFYVGGVPADAYVDGVVGEPNFVPDTNVTVRGTLEGNFDPAVGYVKAYWQGGDAWAGVQSDGSFEVTVPGDSTPVFGYIEWDPSTDSYTAPNGNPDVHLLGRHEAEVGDLGTLTVPAGHELDVKLVDDAGNPVKGTQVTVMDPDPTSGWVSLRADTNADGLYQLSGADTGIEVDGTTRIVVYGPKDENVTQSRFVDVDGPQTVRIEQGSQAEPGVNVSVQQVQLYQSTEVRVRVSATSLAYPLGNATVELSGAGVDSTVKTNETGVATTSITATEPGTVEVTVDAVGYAETTRMLSVEGEEQPLAGQYDRDGDGLDLREVQTAIQDFSSGQIGLRDVQSLIQTWAS